MAWEQEKKTDCCSSLIHSLNLDPNSDKAGWMTISTRHDIALCSMVWYDIVWYDMAWYGMAWYGMIWHGMVWHGMAWYDMVRYG